ncbi:MAG: 2-hydroxyglutaryl-CoA dehydratase [Spirochaetota bacterium]|nr:2-hydroxyglutaryl-CoA dehydratase [Spirochaetota bacterium]
MKNVDTLEKRNKLIEEELLKYEAEERKKLNINRNKVNQWVKPTDEAFFAYQTKSTTVLHGGLTRISDYFVQGALEGLGYKALSLEIPDNEAFRFGKEYCNKGLCNPAYFTIGNLIKFLTKLRDKDKMSVEEIKQKYVFLTAGSKGPCRFGMYEAEYQKALTDSGFDGFRIVTFQQRVELTDERSRPGLELNIKFYFVLIKAVMFADILNTLGYRIRPYEINKGETNAVLEECKEIIYQTLKQRKWYFPALLKVKKKFAKIKVNFLDPKPVVEIIGEFWAMTTEGDGNYGMQKWLENEGAEVKAQKVITWIQYIIYEAESWFSKRFILKEKDEKGLKSFDNPKRIFRLVKLAKKIIHFYYYVYSWLAGLRHEKLPDMQDIADYAAPYYNTNLSGGEGHMEVGKFIKAAKTNEAHMLLSIKPFGCMPSAGVSDGVQSRVQELYPNLIFYPIETTGDNAINIYSRVQMMLFKAKKLAKEEFEGTLKELNTSYEELSKKYKENKNTNNPLYMPKHRKISRAANIIYDLKR